MGKSKKNTIADIEPKRRGRAGAKTYDKNTLYNLVKQYKPSNMVTIGTIAPCHPSIFATAPPIIRPLIKTQYRSRKCN
jgi:hypothetical protein